MFVDASSLDVLRPQIGQAVCAGAKSGAKDGLILEGRKNRVITAIRRQPSIDQSLYSTESSSERTCPRSIQVVCMYIRDQG